MIIMDTNTEVSASFESEIKQTRELTEREKLEIVKRELVAALQDTNDSHDEVKSDLGGVAEDRSDHPTSGDIIHEVTAQGGAQKEEKVAYVPPLQDPFRKAVRYLEEHNILQLFQGITSGIIYQRPGDPIKYMADEIGKLQEAEKVIQETNNDQSDVQDGQDIAQKSS
ncbi:uncharacterized protein LOC106159829 [Lingula anatina]|uniref:Uncharacterized protein LOC106159829 n=1 Tax=Lingula anatina TaxID=7574 RepID=A0A1S3I2V6_LINAN|nr:uncharacterized protein LOC106159829 [Lingula anatina]|eukprot:XP_013391684.1 uncharacterized protein LOC106159829 [Lingula anatina]